MGPPPQKRRPKEPLPNGHQRQQRTSSKLASNTVADEASSSCSSAPQPKPAQSFKERLFARPKKKRELTPEPAKIELHSRPQTTIAPFFKKIQAAFGDETQRPKQTQRQKQQAKEQEAAHVPTLPLKRQPTVQTRKRKRDPPVKEDTLSSETEEMLNELRAHYLTAATTLHSHALTSLTKAHTLLIQKLDDDIVASDEDFLQHAENRARKLSQPLSDFAIRSDQRGSDGVLRIEKHPVRDLVKGVEKKLGEAETEMEGLWREWVESEEGLERVWEEVWGEVEGVGKGKKAKNAEDDKGKVAGREVEGDAGEEGEGEDLFGANGEAGMETEAEKLDGQDVLAKYEEAIQEEIEKAEEEVTELTNLTYQMMKDLEKDYRKAIIPDLHIFYTSLEDV
ncbi:hypothetical protein QBC45DRAFT_322750 [Copromyces sp. CBS 386.78]|nr:hypothetical protein QBC45DRAFT_322750 [Copromyces sp. CBS 386.78]